MRLARPPSHSASNHLPGAKPHYTSRVAPPSGCCSAAYCRRPFGPRAFGAAGLRPDVSWGPAALRRRRVPHAVTRPALTSQRAGRDSIERLLARSTAARPPRRRGQHQFVRLHRASSRWRLRAHSSQTRSGSPAGSIPPRTQVFGYLHQPQRLLRHACAVVERAPARVGPACRRHRGCADTGRSQRDGWPPQRPPGTGRRSTPDRGSEGGRRRTGCRTTRSSSCRPEPQRPSSSADGLGQRVPAGAPHGRMAG